MSFVRSTGRLLVGILTSPVLVLDYFSLKEGLMDSIYWRRIQRAAELKKIVVFLISGSLQVQIRSGGGIEASPPT